jgi:hypothetical protein
MEQTKHEEKKMKYRLNEEEVHEEEPIATSLKNIRVTTIIP